MVRTRRHQYDDVDEDGDAQSTNVPLGDSEDSASQKSQDTASLQLKAVRIRITKVAEASSDSQEINTNPIDSASQEVEGDPRIEAGDSSSSVSESIKPEKHNEVLSGESEQSERSGTSAFSNVNLSAEVDDPIIDVEVLSDGSEKSTNEPLQSQGNDLGALQTGVLSQENGKPTVVDQGGKENLVNGVNKMKKQGKKVKKTKEEKMDVRGKNKSNRFWKTPSKARSSAIIRGPHVHRGWEKQQKLRQDLQRIKELSRQLLKEKAEEKEAARLRAEENRKRREENRKKSEIVQVIKNTAKLKKMKKKQLKMIEKRDTNALIKT